jgi:hypothetical protein
MHRISLHCTSALIELMQHSVSNTSFFRCSVFSFSVDGTPVRVFRNHESQGLPYLSRQAMKVHATIWDGSAWATRGGRDKTDWSHAPFVASYRTYGTASACVSSSPASDNGGAPTFCCPTNAVSGDDGGWMTRRLGPDGERAMASARDKYMVMDYCEDPWNMGRPAECDIDQLGSGGRAST